MSSDGICGASITMSREPAAVRMCMRAPHAGGDHETRYLGQQVTWADGQLPLIVTSGGRA